MDSEFDSLDTIETCILDYIKTHTYINKEIQNNYRNTEIRINNYKLGSK